MADASSGTPSLPLTGPRRRSLVVSTEATWGWTSHSYSQAIHLAFGGEGLVMVVGWAGARSQGRMGEHDAVHAGSITSRNMVWARAFWGQSGLAYARSSAACAMWPPYRPTARHQCRDQNNRHTTKQQHRTRHQVREQQCVSGAELTPRATVTCVFVCAINAAVTVQYSQRGE